MHKIFLGSLFSFSLAFALGACTSPEINSCENFREVRGSCDGNNAFRYQPVSYDLCNNVDPECKAFYDCAAALPCVPDARAFVLGVENEAMKIGGKPCIPRSQDPECGKQCCPVDNYRTLCQQPEDKECTDEDLRIPEEEDDE
ncbi:hypothetical protein [Nannocystis bainbridge]|uniref:Lipoprotein n=1 Tax=Nannocystis bainbridge TaxID=2995303 RepID=A0ABT5E2P4_9BACT|nr:hypothetical protein [Nannocystis bainbridge]MDC0720145.1 hypothetical protein [Nannocystis bainbridge]